MNSSRLKLPTKFQGIFSPYRYKAFHGGRGSGKSHSVGGALVTMAANKPLRILCAREIQKSIKDSVKLLIEDKIKALQLESFYTITDTEIRGKNGSLFLFAGIKTNPESIKSMEAIDICWVEEASTISQKSLDILVPTIRKEGSELWFTWNPQNELDPVDMMFRGKTPPPNSLVTEVNWKDNPWFPKTLFQELEFDRLNDHEKYLHVWEGGYQLITDGAYYAQQIGQAIQDGRITRVPHDPHANVFAAFDLGISDMTSIWFAQIINHEVHVIDFIQSSGQAIDWYARIMREKPYIYEKLILPHDARARSLGTGKSIEEVLIGLGFRTEIAPNIPVKDGIDQVRAFLGKCWFDQTKCEEGLKALRSYRINYDEKLRIARGPLHDQNSHASDAFRYLAVSQLTEVKKGDYTTQAKNYLRFANAISSGL